MKGCSRSPQLNVKPHRGCYTVATVRVAIIADIHANVPALEAVWQDLSEQRPDLTIINGDMVNRGPSNVAVLERLWDEAARGGVVVTLGNHDDLMRKCATNDPELPPGWSTDPLWTAMAWSARQLEAAGWLDELAALPMTHRVGAETDSDLSQDAPSVLVSHGSPRHYREGYGERTPAASFAEITGQFPSDVLVGSHTHQPFEGQWQGRAIYNTGAVGAPFNGDPRAQYLMLELRGERWQADFRRVPYDRAPALKAFETSGLLDEGGLSAHIFREELKRARSYLTPFWVWTEKTGLPASWDSWQRFEREFPERFA